MAAFVHLNWIWVPLDTVRTTCMKIRPGSPGVGGGVVVVVGATVVVVVDDVVVVDVVGEVVVAPLLGVVVVKEKTLDTGWPLASVIVTVNEEVPALMGVPDSNPPELNVRPLGIVPVSLHEYGTKPPVPPNWTEYEDAVDPEGSGDVVVIARRQTWLPYP